MPIKLFFFSFGDQWGACSLRLYGCLLLSSHCLFTHKKQMIPKIQTSRLLRLLKNSMQTAISVCRTMRSFLNYTTVCSRGYICGGVDKAGYLRKTSVTTNLPCLVLTKKNHPTFPDSGHVPFPLCAGMEVTGVRVTMGRLKPKVRLLRKIELSLTSKADG